ncbi:hypothetical protein ND748_03230 [Frankia sp. AiPs1]|uniref:hypothetical protein n=1 Tax=Frankia sp. AiPs1 TaxID=573493 RepID=UPI0020438433|nr:hypothetical protein [Frankia sp. AiPs1]MCM3920690.1 hypothetical protein [Frankia sp. AiPs1]
MPSDVVRESAQAGRLVLWEESARDGAQGKTLMSAGFRLRLAREQGRIFGSDGARHVVFAAGFPSVCSEEFEATRTVALESAGAVSPAAVCRATVEDVRLACAAVVGAANARVMMVVPASDRIAEAMLHRPARAALGLATDLLDAAFTAADGVAVDVCLADAPHADPALLADQAARLTDAGAGIIVIADTVGDLLPSDTSRLFTGLRAAVGDEVILASHLHNDLGLGLANTLEGLRAGVRVASSSWLGVAERSGMVATEQLLFLLAHREDRGRDLLGPDCDLWWTAPDLTLLPPIARMVSAETGIPLTVTTPIVGTGVGTISTGTPFVHPEVFQPFDPERLLGIEATVLLTHLASGRVVRAVAERLGYRLDRAQTTTALRWAKARAYRRNEAVVPDEELASFLDGLGAARDVSRESQ